VHYFPLFHHLQNRLVVIIGGGQVALRKAKLLQQTGAKISVIAPQIEPELQTLVRQTALREYQTSDLNNAILVIAATNNQQINQKVSSDAEQLNIAVNVVDNLELSNVIFPAIVKRNSLMVAISSSGVAPVLARIVRSKIEALLPANLGELATLASKFRVQVKSKLPNLVQRRSFWQQIFSGSVASLALNGNLAKASQMLTTQLENPSQTSGEVYLVGAGPGDPDLLTFKALRLMQQADVVLYDRLVSAQIVELCRRDAKFIYVGKKRKCHSLPQDQINQLLIKYAQKGLKVLRLKGGDPFIFGRGGEELGELHALQIPLQIVPGITAASGCAAYAGIPLTHRDYAQSVRFVTGHLQDGSHNLPWSELVNPKQTLVFYMSLMGLPIICQKLIEFGANPNLNAALIAHGTTLDQQVIVGTLADLPAKVAAASIKAPTLLIVGEVVKLQQSLAWFNREEQ